MDRKEAGAIVRKLTEGAMANPWVPFGIPPQERYHHLPDGLNLCLTLDILTKAYVNRLAGVTGAKPPEALAEGGGFWHLSITRVGAGSPAPAEVEFWCRAFFEEDPMIEVPGLLADVQARHFFWRMGEPERRRQW